MTAKQPPPEPAPPARRQTGNFDILAEQVVSFSELARRLPRRRNGRPTHTATVHRWRQRGLKGIRLEAIRLGGSWATSLEAYRRFCEALTRLADPSVTAPPSTVRRDEDSVSRRLDELGIS